MIYAILAMLFYSIALLFITAASRHANTNIVTAIVNSFSAAIPIIIATSLVSKKVVTGHKFGLIMAVCGGLAIALFGLALTKAFTQNKVGIVTPIVFGGAIFISTLTSLFIFKEKTSPLQVLGLLLVGVGLITIVYARVTTK